MCLKFQPGKSDQPFPVTRCKVGSTELVRAGLCVRKPAQPRSELCAGIALLRLGSAAVLLVQSGYMLIVVSDNSGSPVADAGTRSLIIFVP